MTAGLNVGVVGGSIAGCCAAILLSRAGHRVTVLERSAHGLVGRGGGIGTSGAVFDRLIADDLLDRDFPHTRCSRMPFVAARAPSDRLGVTPWYAPLDLRGFHWSALWKALRHRVPEGAYHRGREVTSVVRNDAGGVVLRLTDGTEHAFDLVLFADGYQSTGRAALFPDGQLAYRGYALWRGVLDERELDDITPIDDATVRVSFSGMPGDLVLYCIPREDGSTRVGERIVNWAAYVPVPEAELPAFMIDNRGKLRSGALPPGSMRPAVEAQLKALVAPRVPSYFGDLLQKARNTYVQLIFNNELQQYAQGRICLVGDAGMVIQPFTGSGVFKGLNNVEDLLKALASSDSLDVALEQWSTEQVRIGRRLLALADQMEQALIWNRLDFATADAATTEAWWHATVKWPDEFSLEKT